MFSANGSQVSSAANYIEDVFSTYLYTGTGATQNIVNGIDLAGKGGLTWLKYRTNPGSYYNHQLVDTVRGANQALFSNLTDAQFTTTNGLNSFNSDGFTVGSNMSQSTYPVASWTFRKQPKFFDVVTYTGNGTTQNIAHNLGSTPGCIIVKRYSDSGWSWRVYHRSLGNTQGIYLDLTNAAATSSSFWNNTDPTSTQFTVGNDGGVNGSGQSFIAYIFAHDAGGFGLTGTDNVISCGSLTTNGSGTATVTLGYEPQWLLIKSSSTATNGDWYLIDTMRGWNYSGTNQFLAANLSGAEGSYTYTPPMLGSPTATGFNFREFNGNCTYIYIAIRRGPMKVPTDATKVFAPVTLGGNSSGYYNATINPDLSFIKYQTGTQGWWWTDRLRGNGITVDSSSTSAEASNGYITIAGQPNTRVTTIFANGGSNATWNFQRAPSFFDEVCYTGSGTFPQIVKHNLGVQPELVIIKGRNDSTNGWWVGVKALGTYPSLYLNGTNAAGDLSYAVVFESTNATDLAVSNYSGINYTAWMWATLPGVSKVGKYTGNGSSQTINCGFTGGARFVLIKRTDSTGDWYVWDTARGIVSGNDPHLSLNTTAAEVTTDDTIDPDSSGFIVNQLSATNVNVNAATYIFLAIA